MFVRGEQSGVSRTLVGVLHVLLGLEVYGERHNDT